LEAIELTLPSGARVEITADGDVAEFRSDGVRIARVNRRRDDIRREFRNAPLDGIGWLSYVPPNVVEVIVRTRRAGVWSYGPTYRVCGRMARADMAWATSQTNAFLDRIATLAGYPRHFRRTCGAKGRRANR
jgi:hypothetical protein